MEYPEHEPEVCRGLRLMQHLGFPPRGDELEFPLGEQDRAAGAHLRATHDLSTGEYVCLHPGARDPARRWAPASFAAVGDALAGRGLRVVLTGSATEVANVQAVRRAMRQPSVDLSGLTDLGALAALLESARLVVCNDTGVSHLAAALRVPSVVVFVASDRRRWAPLDECRHRPVDIRTCDNALRDVLVEVDRLLEAPR